jgi:hypothetical protein
VSAPEIGVASEGHTTRRAILGAGIGALLATIAGALGRPQSALGANGDPLVLGNSNASSSTTVLLSSDPASPGLSVVNTSTGAALHGGGTGAATILGFNAGGNAFDGTTKSGNGVIGRSDSGIGVQGRSNTEKGVYGYSNTGPGVYAYSGGNNGIWGYANGASAYGALGQAKDDSGTGAAGQNLTNGTIGLLGTPRNGVEGRAPNALGFVGVKAFGPEAATALFVDGVARFSRSGKASVAAGKSLAVAIQGGLSAASIVVATPMLNRPGVYVQSAVPNANTGNLRINLNKVASSVSSTPIAWFVIN